MKLLAIGGSPRLEGNTNYLIDQALEEASKLGAEVSKLVLSQHNLNPCLGCDDCDSFDSCPQNDDMAWILDRFCEADAVILATPVYYYNVSAQMKAFIDRNFFIYTHDRKSKARAVGIILVAMTEGIEDALHSLKKFIECSFDIDDDKLFTVSGFAGSIGEAKNKVSLVQEARKLGRRIVETLEEGS